MNKIENNEMSHVAIISHGLSDDKSSEFINTLINKISVLPGVVPITHNFSFAQNKTTPSASLDMEVKDLKKIVEESKKTYKPKSIFLIGKSLGGLVGLAYKRKYPDVKIAAIFILGFPFKLGYPPKLNLLSENNPILPDYVSEYKNLFKEFNVPIFIIQGSKDDLGEVRECEDFCEGFSNCSLELIENANHGFTNVDKTKKFLYEECGSLVVAEIKKSIDQIY